MKKRTLTVLFALAALSAGAQSKFDPMSLMRLQGLQHEVEASAKKSGKLFKTLAQEKEISVTVLMKNGVDAASLAGKGFDIAASREEIGVVTLPLSRIGELNDIADVSSMSYGARYTPTLTVAHKLTGVDKIHSGEGLSMPYTGKGILIADIDNGFDPTHIFFCDKDGKTRVKYFSKGKDKVYTTQEEIMDAGTDDFTSYHSAHVLGIAAGYFSNENFTISGVAPEADIAMGTMGTGTTEEIIQESEKVVAFSKTLKEPLVLNYSLGSNFGVHDSTDMFSVYINKVVASNDAVVCISAGNSATYPVVQKKTLQSDDDQMAAYIYMNDFNPSYYYDPCCMIIGDGKEPFDVSLVLYDTKTKKVIKTYEPSVNVLSDDGDNYDEEYSKYFSGTLRKTSGVEDGRERYIVSIIMWDGKAQNQDVLLGYVVKSKKGREFVCYATQNSYLVKDVTDYDYVPADGITPDGTINCLAPGSNILCVGSYNSRDKGQYASGEAYSFETEGETNVLGDVSSFSGWGTVDGKDFPHITAPGCLVISAVTEDYLVHAVNENQKKYTDFVTVDGRTHYWQINQGTSMSTPYVSGTAALWLEADPTLTMAQVKEIAMSTAIKDDFVKNTKYPVQFGAGKIDAYNGLKKVLDGKSTGLRTVDADKDMLFRSTGDNSYEAYVAGETAITVDIYDMSGRRAYSRRTAGNSVEFSLSSLPKGIYAVELCGSKTSHKIKVAVK